MLRGYDASYTILAAVRDACAVELQSRSAAPARISIVPGAIAWDDCDTCGLLALSTLRHFFTDQFPIEVVTTDMGPGTLQGSDMAIQMIRCAPTPPDGDLSPSVAALDASAHEVLNDAFSLICATHNQLQLMKTRDDIVDFMLRQVVYVGPEGACVGCELTFAVAVLR
jgi:hypothetical protein